MIARSLSHVPDHELIAALRTLLAEGRVNLCEVLLHPGEIDARRLHLPAAYPSLFEYCVRELHMSEGEAHRRIRAARVVRRYPGALGLLADGRLHLTALVLLAPYLRADNARDLFQAATHRSKAEIELLLAQRFPRPDVPTSRVPMAWESQAGMAQPEIAQLTPASVEFIGVSACSEISAPRAAVTPLAPERFALKCTLLEQEVDSPLRGACSSTRVPSDRGQVPRPLGSASCSTSLRLSIDFAIVATSTLRLAAPHAPGPTP